MNSKPKDRNQHIKVFARVRPRNTQELRSHVVVECTSTKDIAVKDKGQTKNFAFDRVFGPESKQVDVYKAVVAPMISEVLQGYNCTVFAYGQTGTGKTFTMVGDRTKDMTGGWENDPLCGIVPRTLDHLFDELKVRAEEYTVRVSFLELYNEELCDLLAPADNDDTKTLRLFEDSLKKGSVIVSGLEERTVYEKNDVYPILEAGSLRRQTAPTLMNASSSRSHTIFTITVHVKVTTPEGEDLFKTGKLNLVDLAGSENIGRSGAVDMRAREAGNINQSLLTLGRVITSLVERTPHVPYRESKLTRILQDSLGGRTKTSIIATVSPALCNLEETLSTFDYAHRARNITNKPEINQKTSKQVLIKNYTDEIERLRRDLMAMREKHGVYLLNEDYNGMLTQIEGLNKDLINKIQLLKVREDELVKQEDIMQSLNMNLYETKNDLNKNLEILQVKEEALRERERALQELNNQAQVLLRTADEAIEDSRRLHDRLDRARMIHSQNEQVVEKFKSRFVGNLVGMKGSTQAFQARGAELVEALISLSAARSRGCREHERDLAAVLDSFLLSVDALLPDLSTRLLNQLEKTKPALEQNVNNLGSVTSGLEELSNELSTRMEAWLTARGPAWRSLADQLTADLDNQKKMGDKLETAQSSVQDSATLLTQMPADMTARCKMEEQCLEQLEAKKKGLLAELQSIREEREALLERERIVEAAMRTVDEDMAEGRRRMEETRQKAAKAAADGAGQRLVDLLQLLTSLANINSSLITSAETVVPTIDHVREEDEKESAGIKNLCEDVLTSARAKCSEVTESLQSEASSIGTSLEVGHKARADAAVVVSGFRQRTQAMAEEEEQRLTEADETTLAANRKLAGEISDFCEETFANIHDRCTELKIHFKEEFLRDEKTGYTPQRKEFQYPKRLVTSGKLTECQENIPPPALSQSKNDSSTTE